MQSIRRGDSKLAQIEGYLSNKSNTKSRFIGIQTDPKYLIEDFEHVAREQVSF